MAASYDELLASATHFHVKQRVSVRRRDHSCGMDTPSGAAHSKQQPVFRLAVVGNQVQLRGFESPSRQRASTRQQE